jgi:hypothetical protein
LVVCTLGANELEGSHGAQVSSVAPVCVER